jgi:hypothetical protein
VTRLVAALAVGAVVLTAPATAAAGPSDAAATDDGAAAIALLERALTVSREVPHSGELTVASFGEGGPQLTEVVLTRGVDGGMSVADRDGREFSRVDGQGFLRSAGTLVRLGGIERLPVDLDRLVEKYDAGLAGTSVLDTGPASVLELLERDGSIRREVLHVDDASGLIVRRETYAPDGHPLRVVAFTSLEVATEPLRPPEVEDLEVETVSLSPADLAALDSQGFEAPDRLPAEYTLVGGYEVDDASVPTLHLVYTDGLYTLSLFQQQGRLSRSALEGATALRTPTDGVVWRWPGSEPRRVIWTGDGRTYTVLTDAPVDEVLEVIAGLPNDPPPSTLDRLARGMSRVGRWLWRLERSEP